MNRILLSALVSMAVLNGISPVFAGTTEWTIDPAHSDARFAVKHMMVSNVNGDFTKIKGTVDYDGQHLNAAKVEASIDANSINTHNQMRDDHLKSPEFFDVTKYPTLTFKSNKLEQTPEGMKIYGDLTIHGVTKPVVLDADPLSPPIKDPYGNLRIGTSARTKIHRKDFDINFNKQLDNGGAIVGDDVAISLDVEVMQKAQPTR